MHVNVHPITVNSDTCGFETISKNNKLLVATRSKLKT